METRRLSSEIKCSGDSLQAPEMGNKPQFNPAPECGLLATVPPASQTTHL